MTTGITARYSKAQRADFEILVPARVSEKNIKHIWRRRRSPVESLGFWSQTTFVTSSLAEVDMKHVDTVWVNNLPHRVWSHCLHAILTTAAAAAAALQSSPSLQWGCILDLYRNKTSRCIPCPKQNLNQMLFNDIQRYRINYGRLDLFSFFCLSDLWF